MSIKNNIESMIKFFKWKPKSTIICRIDALLLSD